MRGEGWLSSMFSIPWYHKALHPSFLWGCCSFTAVPAHSRHPGSRVSAASIGQLPNWVMVTNGNRKNSLQSLRVYFISVSPQLYRVSIIYQEGKLKLREAEKPPEPAYGVSTVATCQTPKVIPQSHNLDAERDSTLNYYFLSSTAFVSGRESERTLPRLSQPSRWTASS